MSTDLSTSNLKKNLPACRGSLGKASSMHRGCGVSRQICQHQTWTFGSLCQHQKKNLPAYWGSASGAGAPVTVATHMTWCCSDHSGRLVQCMVDCGVSSNFTQGWIARIHEEWAQICHHQISKKKSACMLRISEWRRRAGHGRQSHDLVLLGSLRKANSILEFQMRDLFGNLKATLDHQNPWGMSTGLSTSKKICLHAENRRVAPACRSRLPVTWAGAARITREGKFNVRWLWSFNWETSLETYKLVKSEKESQ